MKTKIIEILRRAMGTNQISARLERIERGVISLGKKHGEVECDLANNLEVLPGTEYSKYAIPVDYPPSRAFAPRYGYSQGKIESLANWFASHNQQYIDFLNYMRTLDVSNIPIQLQSGANLTTAWIGGAICAFDSMALYAMVQKYKPKVYLEIGSGMTTCFAHQAIKDAKINTKIVSIDPQPRGEIDAICNEVIRAGLETYDLGAFDRLEAGDILFFDGSHRSFMNSDVTVFFIDVLPRIKPGVIVHIHDIMLPWDYPDSFKNWYWNEQYLLAIYLMSSLNKLNPLLPTAWICRSPEYEPHFAKPFVNLGSASANLSWRGGGSMWFSKK